MINFRAHVQKASGVGPIKIQRIEGINIFHDKFYFNFLVHSKTGNWKNAYPSGGPRVGKRSEGWMGCISRVYK